MIEDNRLPKIQILIQQGKYGEAEKLLSNLLSEDPNDIQYLSFLAEVYLLQDKLEHASTTIDHAIGLAPDTSYLFYAKSRLSIQLGSLAKAEELINQAIELEAYDPDYFALLANIKLGRKRYKEALDIANRALEIDAENVLALNTRSTALIKLNKSEESFQTIQGALREDPNNAYTHANYGWGLLEKGDYKKSLEHFKEALTNDPTFEYAQAGMIEAMKAKNPIYRVFLKYSFWMSNLTEKYQWGVIIGFYIGFRLLRGLARTNAALQPFLTPLIIALAILVFSTWLMHPISNLFLRFNKYGQLLLDRREIRSSNFVAASFGVFLVGVLLYIVLADERYLTLAVFGFAMMLPFSVMFSPSKYKNSLLYYALAMVLVGFVAIGITFLTDKMFNAMSVLFVLAFVGFQWVANYLLIKEDNR